MRADCRAVMALAVALGLVAGLPGTASAQATAPPPQQPSFRAGVELVSLNVTVTGRGGTYLTGLGRDDFAVYEDGVKQDIEFFSRAQLPIALALLLDTSASMEDKLATAQEAAVGFAKRLRADDTASVIDFDSRVTILQPFTKDAAALEKAIRDTAAGGSTSLYNAIYIALNEIKKSRGKSADEVRREAIVVLSDGEDTSSLLPFEEVLELAKRSETSIYAIGIRSKNPFETSRGFKEADFVLRQLARETGGRSFFPTDVEELPGIYTQIADELASQYTVGYTSKNGRRDGAWRRIVVRVNQAEAVARTKQGYYAPAPLR